MPDPFEALRASLTPINPDPGYAATLRARVARRLAPGGIDMTALDIEHRPAATAAAAIIPYLIVTDARRALDWYADALGARRRGEPIIMPDGRVGHSELELYGGVLYVADESPSGGVAAPRPGEGATVSLTALVPSVDELVERAVRAGATLERAPADNPYGRNAVIRDPFGHRWILSAMPAASAAPQHAHGRVREGDVTYASLWVPDVERAAAFFGSVLGWWFTAGSAPQGRQVEGVTPRHGLWGGEERSNLFVCYAVDDVAAAVERVRAAGGRADEPREEPYGRLANCVDDRGTRFALHQPLGEDAGTGRRMPAVSRQGDMVYVTLEVAESPRARAFYGAVLGWSFSPGRVEDGWAVDNVVPQVGLWGGHAPATAVPMYRVDDIAAAVERVRAAGGKATAPERQPYGLSSECVDDQGTRFHLGEV